MIVIFEGPDASGKTTLMRALHSTTNYEHVCIDRMFFSHVTYAQYYKREAYTDIVKFKVLEDSIKTFTLTSRPLFVYVTALPGVLNERMQRRGEDLSKTPDSSIAIDLFERWFTHFGVFSSRVLKIDTTFGPPIEDLVKRIIHKIKTLEVKGRK